MSLSDVNGTTVTAALQVAPLDYAVSDVPQAALVACNADSTATTSLTVFTRGSLTVSYTQGSLPLDLTIDGGHFVANDTGLTAFMVNGQWQCGDGTIDTVSLQLNAGATETVPILIQSEVLSNSQPTVPESVYDTWGMSSTAFGVGTTSITDVKLTGGDGTPCPYEQATLPLYASQACASSN